MERPPLFMEGFAHKRIKSRSDQNRVRGRYTSNLTTVLSEKARKFYERRKYHKDNPGRQSKNAIREFFLYYICRPFAINDHDLPKAVDHYFVQSCRDHVLANSLIKYSNIPELKKHVGVTFTHSPISRVTEGLLEFVMVLFSKMLGSEERPKKDARDVRISRSSGQGKKKKSPDGRGTAFDPPKKNPCEPKNRSKAYQKSKGKI
uniref:Core-binding (CB) domain-containing protein n=1 Tax=Steinernema glaseri TaxID=37863 RepID=A0A1I7Z0A5_9BILA